MRILAAAGLLICFAPLAGFAQVKPVPPAASPVVVEQPDAERTRGEMFNLLGRYPPSVRGVLGMDPGLLNDETYLGQYPALAGFLRTHPEVARNPGYYVGSGYNNQYRDEHRTPAQELWADIVHGAQAMAGFAMGIALLIWLIKTIVDYRRWNRLTRVQTDVHTKLLDRFTGNEELLSYIQTPAGAKFLESSPIRLDAGPKSVAAPVGRILLSVQGGIVLLCGGIGFAAISTQVSSEAVEPIRSLGMLAIAVGVGFLISAGISFVISQRLGLIEKASPPNPEGIRQA
jgi:hypothetical protein